MTVEPACFILQHKHREARPTGYLCSIWLSEPTDATACDWVLSVAEQLHPCRCFDTSVPGVEHMVGGSSHGYTRWRNFLEAGMSKYGARRNNAMCRWHPAPGQPCSGSCPA